MLGSAVLAIAASIVVAQTDGEKAFKSYFDLVVGGSWTTTIDGQSFEDTYERIFDGRFVRLTTKPGAGFAESVVICGIDPGTKKCTMWGFDADGMVTTGTLTQVDDGTWAFSWKGKGPKGSTSVKARLTRINADSARFEITEQVVDGDTKPFTSVSIWNRKR